MNISLCRNGTCVWRTFMVKRKMQRFLEYSIGVWIQPLCSLLSCIYVGGLAALYTYSVLPDSRSKSVCLHRRIKYGSKLYFLIYLEVDSLFQMTIYFICQELLWQRILVQKSYFISKWNKTRSSCLSRMTKAQTLILNFHLLYVVTYQAISMLSNW